MPRRIHVCPGCQQQVRQRDPSISIEAVRWHLTCAREGPGRPRSPRGRGSPQVVVRLSDAEAAQLDGWRGDQTRAEYLRARGLNPP